MLSELRQKVSNALYGNTENVDAVREHADWVLEFQMAERFLERFKKQGERTVAAYLGDYSTDGSLDSQTRLNLFYSNIITVRAMLYAKIPKVESDRRFLDPNDDIARVAAEMMERVLQNDMVKPDDTLVGTIKESLQDRLLPGMGTARLKYCMEEAGEGDLAQKTDEWCDFQYTNWMDVLWSPCRTKDELRWKAFRSYLNRDEVTSRFGEDIAKLLSYTSKGPDMKDQTASTVQEIAERKQVEVWEIWNKDKKEVLWFTKAYDKMLDQKPDPLGLPEFFPDEAMVANLTSRKYIPKADYAIAQDLYEECDHLQTRITMLTASAKLVGVYDQSSKEIGRMFSEGTENTLIPVNNWAMLADKGGLKGMIDWLPLKDVVEAIQTLQAQLNSRIELLYQVVGMSDIMRGQATSSGTTATEQKIKAQFGSTRIQALQDEFALFVEGLLNKKAHVIRKFYDPERIVKLSNILQTPDAQLAPQAVALIKSDDFDLRVVIRADSMAQKDLAQVKQDRAEYLQAVAQFIGQSVPLIQMNADSFPFLLKLLRFGLAAMPSANEIEGVIDQYAAQVEQQIQQKAQQPPQPSPEQMKVQGQMQIAQAKAQTDAGALQAEHQMELQKMQGDFLLEKQKSDLEMQKMQLEIQQMREEHALKMVELQAKIEADRQSAALKVATAAHAAELKTEQAEQEPAFA